MNAHTRKTYAALLGHPAPRDLQWTKFETLWRDLADVVEQESGDRLAVELNGHRVVFHRPHDGRVSIEDVEQARHLLADTPEPKGHGHLHVVAIDDETARILDFNLDSQQVDLTEDKIADPDPRSRRLRTVERRSGNDDKADLDRFFDEVADHLTADLAGADFVVIGHGTGTSDAGVGLVTRLRAQHPNLAAHLVGQTTIDLSAANDADLEQAAVKAAHLD